MSEKTIYFATGNPNKVREADDYFKTLKGFNIKQFKVDRVEPQNDDPIEVAKFSLDQIIYQQKVKERPLFVEDAGLFIDALKGFPGVYSAYALKTLGNDGILKLMDGIEDRKATFRSTIALITEEDEILIFQGLTNGRISLSKKGKEWGFNPIFIPNDSNKTYAELEKDKIRFSHRIRSLKKMKEHFEGI